MKTKKELMGDVIFYPVIAVFLLVVPFALVIIAVVLVACAMLAIVIIVAYDSISLLSEALWKCIDYIFVVHKENIEGDIIDMEERDEPIFFYSFPMGLSSDGGSPFFGGCTVTTEMNFVHHYFLKIKSAVGIYTIRVPRLFYLKVKMQIRKGVKNISILCEKNQLDGVLELCPNEPFNELVLA